MTSPMPHRHLGRTGLQVSVLSFGSWVTFDDQLDVERATECLDAAYRGGVNLFDNAEAYAGGASERIMGQAIAELGWPRHSYVVTSKYYFGIHDGVNTQQTLNRKYLLEALPASLERFGLDHLDVVYCHRPDPHTPLREVVRAMSDAIDRGWAHYWGTSEWPADDIRGAVELAERYGWHAPVVEQPQYNLFHRRRVEKEYARLYRDVGLGTTIWSPLASGLLTGKYLDGIPDGSRGALPGYEWLRDFLTDEQRNAQVRELRAVADDLGGTLAQLAIAWCAANPDVTSVITGASKVEQVHDNLGAVDLLPKLTDDVLARIDEIVS